MRMLALLTPVEKKLLHASLPAPHETRTTAEHLADILLTQLLKQDTLPAAEVLWKMGFPDRPFQAAYFKNLESDISRWVSRFLTHLYLDAHPSQADLVLHKALLERDCPTDLQAVLLTQTRKRIEKDIPADVSSMRELSLIAVELAQQRQDRRKELKRAPQEDLNEAAIHAATVEYLVVRLRLACDQLAAKQASPHVSTEEKLPFMSLLAALSDQGELLGLLRCYAACEQLLRTGDGYIALKGLLSATPLPQKDHFQLVIYLQNYCVQQSNLGKQDFLAEYLDWMDYRDQHQLLLLQGVIAVQELKNMVTACIKLKQVPRGRAYLNRYIHAVPIAMRSYVETLNAAHLSFAEGDFRKAKRLLLNNPVLDQFDDLDWRSLLLKLYVETIEVDYAGLEDFVHAFRNFLRRCKTLPASRLHLHKAKLAIVEAIMRARHQNQLKVIEARIMEQSLPDQSWLLNFCYQQGQRLS